eukprot:749469-Hanusia_phi.AAC.1
MFLTAARAIAPMMAVPVSAALDSSHRNQKDAPMVTKTLKKDITARIEIYPKFVGTFTYRTQSAAHHLLTSRVDLSMKEGGHSGNDAVQNFRGCATSSPLRWTTSSCAYSSFAKMLGCIGLYSWEFSRLPHTRIWKDSFH